MEIERRQNRTLTDADIAAITTAIRRDHCECSFTEDEVAAIRGLVDLMRETRSYVLKGVISVVVLGIFTILALGFKQWAK